MKKPYYAFTTMAEINDSIITKEEFKKLLTKNLDIQQINCWCNNREIHGEFAFHHSYDNYYITHMSTQTTISWYECMGYVISLGYVLSCNRKISKKELKKFIYAIAGKTDYKPNVSSGHYKSVNIDPKVLENHLNAAMIGHHIVSAITLKCALGKDHIVYGKEFAYYQHCGVNWLHHIDSGISIGFEWEKEQITTVYVSHKKFDQPDSSWLYEFRARLQDDWIFFQKQSSLNH